MDVKIEDAAYLQGRVDAVEMLLSQLLMCMPDVVLHSARNAARWQEKWVTEARDADPAHQNRREPSEFSIPPVRLPPVTLYSAGKLDVLDRVIQNITEKMGERTECDSIALVAATPEGEKNFENFLRATADIED